MKNLVTRGRLLLAGVVLLLAGVFPLVNPSPAGAHSVGTKAACTWYLAVYDLDDDVWLWDALPVHYGSTHVYLCRAQWKSSPFDNVCFMILEGSGGFDPHLYFFPPDPVNGGSTPCW